MGIIIDRTERTEFDEIMEIIQEQMEKHPSGSRDVYSLNTCIEADGLVLSPDAPYDAMAGGTTNPRTKLDRSREGYDLTICFAREG